MKEIIVFLVLALISYGFRLLFISLSKDEFIGAKEATGIITKITDSDSGNIKYYVSFVTVDGMHMNGKSIYYSSTKGKYDKGDSVAIKYFINRNGYARVSLIDDELVSCGESAKTAARNFLIATVVFLIIAAIFFIKNILL